MRRRSVLIRRDPRRRSTFCTRWPRLATLGRAGRTPTACGRSPTRSPGTSTWTRRTSAGSWSGWPNRRSPARSARRRRDHRRAPCALTARRRSERVSPSPAPPTAPLRTRSPLSGSCEPPPSSAACHPGPNRGHGADRAVRRARTCPRCRPGRRPARRPHLRCSARGALRGRRHRQELHGRRARRRLGPRRPPGRRARTVSGRCRGAGRGRAVVGERRRLARCATPARHGNPRPAGHRHRRAVAAARR